MTDMQGFPPNPGQKDIEIGNLKGEVRYLRAIVRHLLTKELATGGKEAKDQLQRALDIERNHLGKTTPERIAFEHAHSEFNKG